MVTMNFSRAARRISRAEGTLSRAVRRTLPRRRRILPQFIASAINCNLPIIFHTFQIHGDAKNDARVAGGHGAVFIDIAGDEFF